MKHTLPILFTMLLCGTSAFPQEGCYSRLQNDTLTIGNSRIERRFVWNGGGLIGVGEPSGHAYHCLLYTSPSPRD